MCVVQIGRFRGQIEVEEAAFFVRSYDPATGEMRLSDGSCEPLAVEPLRPSTIDAALLCRVKADQAPHGLEARFAHSAQAELLLAVEETPAGLRLRVAGALSPLPEL